MNRPMNLSSTVAVGILISTFAFADDSVECKENGCSPKHQTHLGTFTKATAVWQGGQPNSKQPTPKVMVTLHGSALPVPSGMDPALTNHCSMQMVAYPHGLTYAQANAQKLDLVQKGEYLISQDVDVPLNQLPKTVPFNVTVPVNVSSFPTKGAWTIYINSVNALPYEDQDGNRYWSHCDGQVDVGGSGGKNKVFTTLNAQGVRLEIDEQAINRMPITLPGPRREPAAVEDEAPSIRNDPPAVDREDEPAAPSQVTPSIVGAPR
jgi:hypothetical protein